MGACGQEVCGNRGHSCLCGRFGRINRDEAINGSDDDGANHEGDKTVFNSSFTF